VPTDRSDPAVLFPNSWSRSNKVSAGVPYTIPAPDSDYKFKVTGPAGTEYVKVIASLKPMLNEFGAGVEKQLKAKGVKFARIKNAGLVAKGIELELKKEEPADWAETNLSFEIME
jgi:hypothetical protein